jgi:uncharacterized membrane-anchored protein YitT (DUF2179 family)
MKQHVVDWLRQTLLLTLGSAVCALAVKAIMMEQGLLAAGLTGAALVVHYLHPELPVALIYLLINIPVFLIGWRLVGLRFLGYSLWGMLIYALLLWALPWRIELSDPLLAAVVAGGLSGLGIAIILRSCGSTGGTEIISVVLHKFLAVPVGLGAVLVNLSVLAASTLLFPLERVLYSIVYAIVAMVATNSVFHGMNRREAALIISAQWQEIAEVLTARHGLGVTQLHGRGAYQGVDRTILFSVVRRRDLPVLKRIALEHDPDAFITIISSGDVTGLQVGNQPHW